MGHDRNPKYWDEYTNLQHVKHLLIQEYLKGWFPKLGFWSGRIVYLETHAGRGKHTKGQCGSPVVAIETLLSHTFRDRILENSEVLFLLIEHDNENVDSLRKQVARLGDLPDRVYIDISCNDCYQQLEKILGDIEKQEQKIAPAFIFVDPYGFKVPGDLLKRLLAAGRVEIFINIIWRELDMEISQARNQIVGGKVETLNLVFGGERWREIERDAPMDERADKAVDLLRDLYSAQWATSFRMLGNNQITRYVLAHFTNHEAGRDLMKQCMWKVCPEGGFYARRSDNPSQTRLFAPKPNLVELDSWLNYQLREEPLRWSELSHRIRSELWLKTHLSQVIRQRRREGTIKATGYSGRFSEKNNPILSLPKEV